MFETGSTNDSQLNVDILLGALDSFMCVMFLEVCEASLPVELIIPIN